MTIQANFPNVQPSLLLDFANARQLPPSVTFTRATTAAYYDGNTTAKAEENLVYYSQEFDNGVWTPVNTSIVANNTTAPDGTATADKVVIAANTSYHDAFANSFPRVANQQYTHSIYVKAGTGIPAVYLYSNRDAVGLIAKFDISAGTYIGNAGGDGYGAFDSYSITSVGSGWYRITATFTAASNSYSTFTLGISTTTADTVVPIAGNGTDFCYIWGAQLEQRSSATAYTVTTTQPITNYIPVLLTAGGGQPRFDHNPTTSESLGLLIEEQRTNLFSYSSQFDDAYWTKANCSITANANVAPDGTLSADLATATSGLEEIYINTTKAASAITYTLSIYVKPYSGVTNSFVLYLSDNSTGQATGSYDFSSVTASATNGTWANSSATITSVGNGWFRCTLTSTSPANTGLLPGFTWGSTSGQAVFLWGAQLEAASFPTSYIPTTSAAATRAADFASMTGANFTSWFNNGEGTFYSEVSFPAPAYNSSNTYHFEASDGTASNRLIGYTGGSQAQMFVSNGGTTQAAIVSTSPPAINTSYRCAFLYEVNNFALSVNAQTPVTDTSGTVPPANKLNIAANYAASEPLNGWMKKLAYYPQAVTSAQLQALTS